MNNKGFTMVELIATIALLSVIMVISFVSINAVLDNSKINECKALVNNIKGATKEYFSDNRYDLDELNDYKKEDSDKEYVINVGILINKNYLTDKIVDPFDSTVLINGQDIKIDVELNNNYMVKEIVVKNESGNIINCDNKVW